jgi:DHA2 family multidrug resistance protein
MSAAATDLGLSPLERFQKKPAWIKAGFVGALCGLVLLDGVNGAMTSSVGRYLIGTFSVTTDQIAWATIVYYVSKLYALLLAARLQERIGQRKALLGASTLLVVSTVIGAFITNYPWLLLTLFFQAGAGGMVIAIGQGALLTAFPRRDQTIVQALFGLAFVMFPATMAPAYVGAFAYNFDWQDAYLWILPFGLLGLLCLFWNQNLLSDETGSVPVPILKIIFLVISLSCLVYVLQQGERNRWLEAPSIQWALILGALGVVGVAFTESDGRPTYLRYGAFRYANFTFGFSTALLAGVAFLGGASIISGFITGVLAYPVLHSGEIQLYSAVCTTAALLAGGFVLRYTKTPGILIIYVGQILFTIAMWNLGLAPSNTDPSGLVPWLILRGLALGFQFLPIILMTLTCLPAEDNVAAAGLFNFSRQLGALIGIAWLQSLREHLVDRNQTIFGNVLSAASPNAVSYLRSAKEIVSANGISPFQTPQAATALMLQESGHQWASIAFNGCFESLSLLFLSTFPLVILARILTQRFLKPAAC